MPPPPKVTPSKEMKAENIVGLFDAAAAAAPDISVTSPTEVSDQQPTDRSPLCTLLLREEQQGGLLYSTLLYSTLLLSALLFLPSFRAYTHVAPIEPSYSLLSVRQSGREQPAGHGPGLFQCLNQSLLGHTGG